MNCEQVTKEEISEKYLLGRLSEAEQGAFELHFFECERCFEEVESLRMLQTELRQNPSAIREKTSKRQSLVWRWACRSARGADRRHWMVGMASDRCARAATC
jgi:anti-sigma factor RsiW